MSWGGACALQAALFELYRGAVGHDLRGTLHHGGGGVTDVDHGVRTQMLRLPHHAFGGQGAGVVHHVGIGAQFTAHQGLEPLGNIPADVFGLNGAALDQAQHFQLLAGNVISID